ncbi:MAG TPA: amidohydrolase [Sphingomicrobium sp.]|jgi:predicted amidohydrolase YtcJ|nr:amidohydrolase [Sphingomicrobium sp.]
MKTPLLALAAALLASPAFADTLIDNANGIQVDVNGRLQRFTGLLIGDDGKVVRRLGPGDSRPNADTIVDARGQTLLPGFIDGHGHVMDLGFAAMTLQLTGTSSIADLQQRLRAYAAAHPDDEWIIGFGWNQELWPEKRFPTAADLDSIVFDRPVVLERVDGHALVANSAAMKAAGVTAATADPDGGKIERDSTGNPTGLFVDAAKALIQDKVPAHTQTQEDKAFALAQHELLSFGVTGVGSMSTSLADWNTFRRSGEAGDLQVRLMVYLLGLDPLKTIPHPTGWMYDDRLRAVGVKFFADGALGSRGAWLKQPYADKPDTRGLQFHSDAELLAQENAAAAAGFQTATHAIGDAANAQVIGVYEKLHAEYPGDRRWRIEHFQIVDPADIPRMKPIGAVASMQPTHQTSDRLMAEARLGPERLKGAYAWQTVEKLGIPLAFGTDFPVESPNPFPGLSAAISRQDLNGQPPGGWIPSERLTLGQALHAYTRGSAYAGFAEKRIGALDAGKWADFILVDRDPTKVDPQQLGRTQVFQTWIAGKKVWERPARAEQPERGR